MHRLVCLVAIWLSTGAISAAAELKAETIVAYERYITEVIERFARQTGGAFWVEEVPDATRARLRAGAIETWPGHEDGIFNAPDGKIHHWRAAAFIPGVTLEDVLIVARNYEGYADRYQWVLGSGTLGHERIANPTRDRYRLFLRISRSAGVVSSVVDLWTTAEYRYPRADRATAVSDTDCVREVDRAGEPGERRHPVGTGRGYLWRANTLATYLERDGGVYAELETIGLSRGFPPLLGWIIEPIARRLGRGSAEDTLNELRRTLTDPAATRTAGRDRQPVALPTFWCAESPAAAPRGPDMTIRDK